METKAKWLQVECDKCKRRWKIDDSKGLAELALMGKYGWEKECGKWVCRGCQVNPPKAVRHG